MSEKIYTQEEMTQAVRNAIEERAKWFYLLYKYTPVGFDEIAKKAISEFGRDKGIAQGNCDTAIDLANYLLAEPGRGAFAMEPRILTPEKSVIKFRYCALVEAWKK